MNQHLEAEHHFSRGHCRGRHQQEPPIGTGALRNLKRLGGLIDAEIIVDCKVPNYFEIAAANVENRGDRLNALLSQKLPFEEEIVAARADPGASFKKMLVAHVPKNTIVESISDQRIGICNGCLRCCVKMDLGVQQAENVQAGTMIVQQRDRSGRVEIFVCSVKVDEIVDIRWRRLERQAAVLNSKPEADLIDVIFPANPLEWVHIG